jgi:hypothetical protein
MDARRGKIAQYEAGIVPSASALRVPGKARSGKGDGTRATPPFRRLRAWLPMPTYTNVDSFTAPLGGQEIALLDLVHDAGGMNLLRIRIRERTRFTIFDVDPATARRWGEAMLRWSDAQTRGTDGPPA